MRGFCTTPGNYISVELRRGGRSGDNYKMVIVIKWVIVVVGSFVGGFISGFVPAAMVSRITPGSYAGGITLLVGWIVGGIFIWMRLFKLMKLQDSAPTITEDREDN